MQPGSYLIYKYPPCGNLTLSCSAGGGCLKSTQMTLIRLIFADK
jgi:hypothetical protein